MDSYETPRWIMKIFEDWFDPCSISKGELRDFDGLGSSWENKTFVNPPYSKPIKWVEKAIEESNKGKTIAMLLKVDTSTKWFAKLFEAKAHILWINGRLKFTRPEWTYIKGTPATFPSMLVILSKSEIKHHEVTQETLD